MVSSELKMIVAQNCQGYNPRSAYSMSLMGSLSESCSNCSNYVRGKCVKNLFDNIAGDIRMN